MSTSRPPNVSAAGVLREAWGLYRRNGAPLLAMGTAAVVVAYLIAGIALAILGRLGVDGFAHALAVAALGIASVCAVQGAFTGVAVDLRDGRAELAVGELFSAVRPALPALVGAGILAGLGIAVGLILFVVPGVYLLTRWSMVVPVIVLERRSDAFARSGRLVAGNGWAVFSLLVPLLLIGLAAAVVLPTVGQAILPAHSIGAWIGSTLAGAAAIPFVATALTLAYLRLREAAPQADQAESAEGDRRCALGGFGALGLGMAGSVLVVRGFGSTDVGSAAGHVVAASALTCGVLALVLGATLFALAERGRPPSWRWACTGAHKWAAAAGMILGFVFIWPALLLLILPHSFS